MDKLTNYQLYRTNTKLGGQIKWDITVKSIGDKLWVDNFGLSPISNNIPFNSIDRTDLLIRDHKYNIQNLYNEIEGYFYDSNNDPMFKHNWPIIIDDEKNIDLHDSKLETGCSRTLYSVHNKQFEYLVPIWLENLNKDDSLKFKICIKTPKGDKNGDKILSSKILEISKSDSEDQNFSSHNKFVDYFKNYVDFLKLNGDDSNSFDGGDLINIDIKNRKSRIIGVSVKSGNISTIENSNLVDNLLSRERPLMEFDSMIIDTFKEYYLIARQLFNFNIIFNIDDIIDPIIYNEFLGSQLKISIVVMVGGLELPLKDFFTNYEYIEKDQIMDETATTTTTTTTQSSLNKESKNIFNYLKDNTYIDFISSNKFSPNIIHWSLKENNEYIFNMYNGFGGYYVINNSGAQEIYNINKRYGNTPNIMNEKYNIQLNNTGWCNIYYVGNENQYDISKFNMDIQVPNKIIPMASLFDKNGIPWINKIKYYTKGVSSDIEYNSMLVLLMKSSKTLCKQLKDGGYQNISKNSVSSSENYLFAINAEYKSENSGFIIFVSDSNDELTFKNVLESLREYNSPDNNDTSSTQINKQLKFIQEFMSQSISPDIIKFNNGLYINRADSPSMSSSEIEYYKNNNLINVYISRYFGKIKPTFIDIYETTSSTGGMWYNNIYYKKCFKKSDYNINKSECKPFFIYSNSKYEPLYPSIEYYSNRDKILYSDTIPTDKNHQIIINKPEYKWYQNNIILALSNSIVFNIVREKEFENKDELNDCILGKLKSYYHCEEDDNKLKYIFDQYNQTINYDYDIIPDDKGKLSYKYTYNITLTLK